VLAPGYFARQDTKTPVKIGIWAMVANMAMNLALIGPFAHMGLALATSLSAFLNAGLLYLGLRKTQVYNPGGGWLVFVVRLGLASASMAGVVFWLNRDLAQWLAWGWQDRVLWLALLVGAGMAVYFVVLLLCGLRIRHLTSRGHTDDDG
jgi:putative peptidoglycan lipid II flippase